MSPTTWFVACMLIVMLCGSGTGVGEYDECQIVAVLPSTALLAG